MGKSLRVTAIGVAALVALGAGVWTAAPALATAASPSVQAGCTGGGTIPAGAATHRIEDVDGDGRADTEFLTRTTPYRYGIATAAGAVATIPDVLAGPGRHRAWEVATDGQGRAIVIDDGVNATLQEFRDCRIVRKLNRDRQPFLLGLAGSGGPNTGVACTDLNGGTLITASRAVRRADGRYDVVWEGVQRTSAPDVVRLDPSQTLTRWRGLPATAKRVREARTSHCTASPQVVQITR